jgi:hypothetical protein
VTWRPGLRPVPGRHKLCRSRHLLCRQYRPSPMLNRSPTAGATGKPAVAVEPPSSSGQGHRPFKAAARVRIPLGVRLTYVSSKCAQRIVCGARIVQFVAAQHGPVEQLGVLATLSRWRSRVQIPSGPLRSAGRRGEALLVSLTPVEVR